MTCQSFTVRPDGTPAATGASAAAYSQPSPKNRCGASNAPDSLPAGNRKPPPTTSRPFGQRTTASAAPPAATGTSTLATDQSFTFTHTGRTPTAKLACGGCGSTIRVLRTTSNESDIGKERLLNSVPGFTDTSQKAAVPLPAPGISRSNGTGATARSPRIRPARNSAPTIV